MLFNFELRPINEIAPWRPVSAPDARTPEYLRYPHIGWFQLTDGWYWIETGQGELFCYSQAHLEIWKEKYPGHPWTESRYVDYHVVRLWEDLLDMLPLDAGADSSKSNSRDQQRWGVGSVGTPSRGDFVFLTKRRGA
jgi:hypothetical protein